MKIFNYIALIILLASTLFASIGKFTEVKGDVNLLRNNRAIVIHVKSKLEVGDIVRTSINGSAKMVFNDKTTITLGRNTNFEVEDYLFDNTKNSRSKFKVVQGFFKTISGKIGKIARKNFKFKTRNATIGIRGTVFEGITNEARDFIKCDKHAIIVYAQGVSKLINAGEYTIVKQGRPPLNPSKNKNINIAKVQQKKPINNKEVQKTIEYLEKEVQKTKQEANAATSNKEDSEYHNEIINNTTHNTVNNN